MTAQRAWVGLILLVLFAALASAQAVYQPKFKGDPARSESEAEALGYLRTFLRAQKIYKKRNNHFAKSLLELAHTGSFTRRMVNTDRGDYTVQFKPNKEKDSFKITMAPKQLAPDHRSFFADQDGKIRADETKGADENSPILKSDQT
jgi:gamma-glutamylcysteine synthetase